MHTDRLQQLLDIALQSGIQVSTGDPIPDSIIDDAQSLLSVIFPQTYRDLLRKFGYLKIGSEEVLGMDPSLPLTDGTSMVGTTLSYREWYISNPLDIVIREDGFGNSHVLRCSQNLIALDGDVWFVRHEDGSYHDHYPGLYHFFSTMIDSIRNRASGMD
ncbi:MAG: SMI1/KNR4 family protein [Phycisphaerales bacterium]